LRTRSKNRPRPPRPSSAERLKGRKNAFRIRVGQYRLLYEVHAWEIVVYVVGVAHRREVYLRLLRRR
jgi:mRNA interferase RelE/StbE